MHKLNSLEQELNHFKPSILVLSVFSIINTACTLLKTKTASQNKELLIATTTKDETDYFEVFYPEKDLAGKDFLARNSCQVKKEESAAKLVAKENCKEKKVTVPRELFDVAFQKSFDNFIYSNEPVDFLEKSGLLFSERSFLLGLIDENQEELKKNPSALKAERLLRAIEKYQSKAQELEQATVFYSSKAFDLPGYSLALQKTWQELNFWLNSPVPFFVAGGSWDLELNRNLPQAVQTLAKIMANAFESAHLKSAEEGKAKASELDNVDNLSFRRFLEKGRFAVKFKPLELKFDNKLNKWQSFFILSNGVIIVLYESIKERGEVTEAILGTLKGTPACHFWLNEADLYSEQEKNALNESLNKNHFQKLVSKFSPKKQSEKDFSPPAMQVNSIFALNDLHLNFLDEGNFINLERTTVSKVESDAQSLYMNCGFIDSIKFHESRENILGGVTYFTNFIVDSIHLSDTLNSTRENPTSPHEGNTGSVFTLGHFKKVFAKDFMKIEIK